MTPQEFINYTYFNQLGYKVADLSHYELIIKDFQRHCGLKADGIIGVKTKAAMNKYNKNNYCPEVFEPIKPYVPYTDEQIESLCKKGLKGLGLWFNYSSWASDFDVLHSLAHAILESDSGTSKIAVDKNNLYGWACYDSSPYASAKKYQDFKDCIATWSNEWNVKYLEPTGKYYCGNNEYCVNIFYASSPVAGINKSFIVQQLRKKLNES